jgi:o-succinylbenzoate synthase
MPSSITGIKAYKTRLPLIRPYHLSLVTLEAFESVVVQIQADGTEGFGEATDVPGYYTQSLSDAWTFVASLGPEILGENPQAALERMIEEGDIFSFAATPLLTALESLIESLRGTMRTSLSLPLLGIVQGGTSNEIVADAERLIRNGYTTLKLKVGFEVGDDLNRLRHVQACLTPGIGLRIDANQGYDYSQAQQFLEGLDPTGIELLEQPLKPEAWDEMTELAKMSPVPLMLDEAITGEEALDRTIETACAGAVKFKLMKAGSLTHLEKLIKKALAAGLKVILGNGVATDIGCAHEAQAAARVGLTNHAGEMNGFLKTTEQFLQPQLQAEKGNLLVPPGPLSVRWELVERFAHDVMIWGEIKKPGRSL